MSAIDHCEPQVINALRKDGWEISAQPYPIRRIGSNGFVYADLLMKRATDNQRLIVVEVKCFARRKSWLEDFYQAVGQYLAYRTLLQLHTLNDPIYLSIPADVYEQFFQKADIQATVNDAKIKLIVIDLEREEVIRWIR